jgi:hypothetical protein
MRRPTVDAIEREIAALDGLDHPALQQRWRELYKIDPPFKIRSGFLRRAIAYRLQELVYGGLKPSTLRRLRRIADEYRSGKAAAADALPDGEVVRSRRVAPTLSAGTRLLREWNGRMESVDIVAEGLVWRDRRFRTLSAVAVAITGTKWSGPKFFGLTGKRRHGIKSAGLSVSAPGSTELVS